MCTCILLYHIYVYVYTLRILSHWTDYARHYPKCRLNLNKTYSATAMHAQKYCCCVIMWALLCTPQMHIFRLIHWVVWHQMHMFRLIHWVIWHQMTNTKWDWDAIIDDVCPVQRYQYHRGGYACDGSWNAHYQMMRNINKSICAYKRWLQGWKLYLKKRIYINLSYFVEGVTLLTKKQICKYCLIWCQGGTWRWRQHLTSGIGSYALKVITTEHTLTYLFSIEASLDLYFASTSLTKNAGCHSAPRWALHSSNRDQFPTCLLWLEGIVLYRGRWIYTSFCTELNCRNTKILYSQTIWENMTVYSNLCSLSSRLRNSVCWGHFGSKFLQERMEDSLLINDLQQENINSKEGSQQRLCHVKAVISY